MGRRPDDGGQGVLVATVDVSNEIGIDRPVDAVAAYAVDPDNAPRWYANIRSVRWVTPPPLAVGTRLEFVARFVGRTLTYTYEVTELVAGERMVMRTAEGPFPMETTYSWRAASPRTTMMTLRNRGRPTGFPALVAPFMAAAVGRANRKDLRKLKALLEAPDHE